MQITTQTWAAIKVAAFAFGRHAVSYTAGAATAAAAVAAYGVSLHYVSSDQANAIVGALQNIASGVQAIVSGVTTVAGGVGALVAVGMGVWAAHSISPKQAATVAADTLPGTTIVTDPKTAASTKQTNIVSSATNVVAPKVRG